MTLANISAPPAKSTQQTFDYSHYQDHVAIVQHINTTMGKKLQVYPIHPAPQKNDTWQRQHQNFHDDMNAALGTRGTDLTGQMNAQWYNRNYLEHSSAHQKLGI